MSDTDLERWREQVEALLRQRLGGRVWDLRVVVHQGGVILRGRALSYYAKQLAQHAVMQGLGLLVVANDIEVHRTAPGPESQ
jgi:osmotically-inducible protein OsmY